MKTLSTCIRFALVLGLAWPVLGSGILENAMNEPPMQEQEKNAAPLQLHDFAKMAKELDEKGAVWNAFLDNDTMTAGVYRLEKGATDGQSPHLLDEVYHVVAGKARFVCEGETVDVRPGSVLFVAAHAEHRFLDIEEDLELLVFFSKVPVEKEDAKDGDDGDDGVR